MKIYINGKFLSQSVTGVQRFANEILKGMDKIIPDLQDNYEFILLSPKSAQIDNLKLQNIKVFKQGILDGILWEQIELPIMSKNGYLINFCNAAPFFKKKQFNVIHDAAVFANPSNFSWKFRIWYKTLLKITSSRSERIMTVSQYSKKELMKYLNIAEYKIDVVTEGKEHFNELYSDTLILSKNNLVSKNYILAVSSLNPNKNFNSIIKAINLLPNKIDIPIAIAGGTDVTVFAENITLDQSVKYLGYVSDEELKSLYENAFCFIFPSFYEGFGIPPLEAMSVGCPVILSNTSSMPEVGGNAVLYCDPSKPETIAQNILTLYENPSLKNELIESGKVQSLKFSWDKGAQEILDIVILHLKNKK